MAYNIFFPICTHPYTHTHTHTQPTTHTGLHSRPEEKGAGLNDQKPQEQVQPNVKQAQSWVMSCKGLRGLPSCIDTLSTKGIGKKSYVVYAAAAAKSLQSCLTLCDPMNCSMPALPLHHQLLEFTQIHVYRVSDAIQPSHPRLSPSPAPNPSQHQSLFQ